MLEKVDRIIIGGAMANTFLKKTGVDVGNSLVEDEMLAAAGTVMEICAQKGIGLCLPVDVAAGDRFDPGAELRIVPVGEIPRGWMALDIGPGVLPPVCRSIGGRRDRGLERPHGRLRDGALSAGVPWRWPNAWPASTPLTIVGGGDTDAAVHQAGVTDRISYISTGGGAFLTLLEGKHPCRRFRRWMRPTTTQQHRGAIFGILESQGGAESGQPAAPVLL